MDIFKPKTPGEHLAAWLPGELEYSVRKAGYDEKIRRAKLPLDHPQSMYTFLASEWYQHRLQRRNGAHYMPFHGKSAQLQAAKFVAGFFDKAGLMVWLARKVEPTNSNFSDAANRAAIMFSPDIYDDTDRIARKSDFSEFGDSIEETPFDEGIKLMIDTLVELDTDKSIAINIEELNPSSDYTNMLPYIQVIQSMGNLAAVYYADYAQKYLTPDQYELPKSFLEEG